MSTTACEYSGFRSSIAQRVSAEHILRRYPIRLAKEHDITNKQITESFEVSDYTIEGAVKTDKILQHLLNADTHPNTFSFSHDEEMSVRFKSQIVDRFWGHPVIRPITGNTILNNMRILGFDAIAERLESLYEMAEKEEDEKPIVPGSLRNFYTFIQFAPRLPTPHIGINPDGLLQAVWRVPGYGTLAMNFLASNDIMFAVILHRRDSTLPRQKISGVMPLHKTMYHIREFVDKLIA